MELPKDICGIVVISPCIVEDKVKYFPTTKLNNKAIALVPVMIPFTNKKIKLVATGKIADIVAEKASIGRLLYVNCLLSNGSLRIRNIIFGIRGSL